MQLHVISPPSIDQERKVNLLLYQPLRTRTSIRLLKIHPLDQLNDEFDLYRPLRFSLITKDLDDFPEFDALSYTWGNPRSSEQKNSPSPEAWSAPAFDVNNDDQPVSGTTNLFTALLALRVWSTPNKSTRTAGAPVGEKDTHLEEDDRSHSQFSRYIWIDQICINQVDIPERNSQVQLMGRIYRQAQCALLGIQECLLDVDFSKGPSFQAVKIFEPGSYKANCVPYIFPQQWFRLHAFLNRSWFRRSWIVQEIGFAKRVNFLCGLALFNYLAIAAFHTFLDSSGWFIQLLTAVSSNPTIYPDISYFGKIVALRYHLVLDNDSHKPFNRLSQQIANRSLLHLSELIRLFRSTHASDARDKVYALVGMSKEYLEDTKMELIPDYHKSPRDVYIQTAKFLISSTKNLDCFSLKESEVRTRLASLPSWVPDFSIQQGHNPLFCATLPCSAKLGNIRVGYLPGEAVEVQGVRVGSIQWTQEFISIILCPSEHQRWEIRSILGSGLIELLQLLPEVSHIPMPPSNQSHGNTLTASSPTESAVEIPVASQSRLEVLWRTLLHDHVDEIYPAPAHCIDDFLADMKFVVLTQIANSLSYIYHKPIGDTGHVDWESSRDAVGNIYTAWKKLIGLCPYDMKGVVYPPGYEVTMQRLGDAWNHKNMVGMEQVDRFCSLTERRWHRLANGTSRRLAVRNRSMAASMGRAMFITCTGYLGTGLESVRMRDEVWVLAGASVPCVLRPVVEKRYHLVGDAYVHGLMHGDDSVVSSGRIESVIIV
ncbi:Heterokaryon incompatibility protein (HET) domain containing protein [Rhypophila decipiens]